jgi:hypothetical protein
MGRYLLNQPKFGGIQIPFEPFEYFWIGLKPRLNRPTQNCAGRARLLVPCRRAASLTPLPPAPRRWHRAPLPPDPPVSRAAPCYPHPTALSYSPPPSPWARTASFDRTAWSHSDPVIRLPTPPPPLFLSFSLRRVERPSRPPFLPRAPAKSKKSPTPHSAPFYARAQSPPPLLHHLRACLTSSRHRTPLLLSGPHPSATASAASRWDPPICHRCPHLRPPSPSLFRAHTTGSCLHCHRPSELSPHRRTPPPEASSTASTSCHRSGELHPQPPCTAPSLWPPWAHRQHLATGQPPQSHRWTRSVPAPRAASPSDRAARPRPSQPYSRSRMEGRHALWAVFPGRIGPSAVHSF